jgi:hypothetical protein
LLQVLGSGYLPELLAVIPEENLPTMFGGKSPCDCTDIGPWQVSIRIQINNLVLDLPAAHASSYVA